MTSAALPDVYQTRAGRFRPSVLAAAVVGFALCGVGGTQTVGSLLQIRGLSALERLRTAPLGSLPDTFQSARSDFAQSDRWRRDPANDFNIATLYLRMTAPGDEPGAARVTAAAARSALERGLQDAPGNADAWILLAQARVAEWGPSQSAIEAFRMSLALARYEPSASVWRCQVGLALYAALDATGREEVAEQIRMLARESMGDLAKVARASGQVPLVVAVLSNDTSALNRFSWSMRAAP